MKEKSCGIYCIENIKNNKKYIGKSCHIEKRFRDHRKELNENKHINEYLQRSWIKYGESSFIFYIIEICEKNNEILSDREMFWVKVFDSKNNGYNLTDGGNGGGMNPTLETREKRSKSSMGRKAWNKGIPHTEETKQKISESCKGKVISKESIQKRIEKTKGVKRPNITGENNPMYGVKSPMTGRKHSEESKKKMSDSQKEKVFTEEHRNKISSSQAGKGRGIKSKTASSKFFGIYYNKKKERWIVSIKIYGKTKYIGCSKDEVVAAKIYDKYIFENKLNYPLNFPENIEEYKK